MIIIDYQIVTGTCDEVSREVKKLIAKGWQPFGAISTAVWCQELRHSQAMVMYLQ